MSAGRDGTSSPGCGSRPDDDRLAPLAARLGVELPPFPGPLVAFDPADRHAPGDPVYLGGDLHAVHPEMPAAPPTAGRDRSLDAATITLTDFEHPALETVAIEGIWCLAIEAELLDSVPYFSISDSEARLRTWILLPPVDMMIGLVHLSLPAVPPLPQLPGSPGDPSPAS
jgi:hypothetical protein